MAVPAIACLALAAGILVALAPRGFVVLGERLDLPFQLALAVAAVAAGAWGALSAREGRVVLGAALAAGLLVPAQDPAPPLERLAGYLGAAALFLLFVEFALLHAKIARLRRMPRAHVTQAGQAREVELQAVAGRIAASWPGPLALALGLLGLAAGLQALLASAAPPALGQSVELRGPYGLALAALAILGSLGAAALRPRRGQPAPGGAPPEPSPGPSEPSEGPAPASSAARP